MDFTRNGTIHDVLGIGKKVQIDNWFDKWKPSCIYDIDDNYIIHIRDDFELGFYFASDKPPNLPDNLYIHGDMDLRYATFTKLPKNLHVDGSLDLYESAIDDIPGDLYVGRYLTIRKTRITKVPSSSTIIGGVHDDSDEFKDLY